MSATQILALRRDMFETLSDIRDKANKIHESELARDMPYTNSASLSAAIAKSAHEAIIRLESQSMG